MRLKVSANNYEQGVIVQITNSQISLSARKGGSRRPEKSHKILMINAASSVWRGAVEMSVQKDVRPTLCALAAIVWW